MKSAQLQLVYSDNTWKLDRRTIEIGRAGLAQARAALDAVHTIDDEIVADSNTRQQQSAEKLAA